jgi:NAD(P) transhydrogenase subunit alpha
MIIGLPKEIRQDESRVGLTPEAIKKLAKKGFRFRVEKSAGEKAGFPDSSYVMDGVELGDAQAVWHSDIIFKVHRPTEAEVSGMKKGSLLISLLEPYLKDGLFQKLAHQGVHSVAMELIPRTSRAQSMDVLSSQANIAGYRAVIEAGRHYGRFLPLMMTSAGSSKPAKVMILGVGVAGLQAIATAKRLGASVEAYDIRPEVKEQIVSLGAKVVELEIGEEGSGQGGYAKELSAEGKAKQQALLTERLKKCDIIISTANIPGRRAPVLITEEAVKGMRPGSVIVDMAAANGGNCPLSEAHQVVVKHGVTLIGLMNYPSLVPTDSSQFFANNLVSLLSLMLEDQAGQPQLKFDLQDDIIAAALVTYQGEVRLKQN